jgi:16S rRNA (uracil1498-N3)-methyltransferase
MVDSIVELSVVWGNRLTAKEEDPVQHRYRFIGSPKDDTHWQIVGDEANHLRKVLRLAVGEDVEVADGRGAWIYGKIRMLTNQDVLVEMEEAFFEAEEKAPVTIAFSALKPASVDDLLPLLCELGVDRIGVFVAEGVAKNRVSDKVVKRWERILTSSIKQCKRAYLPQLSTFDHLDQWLINVPPAAQKVFLDPQGSAKLQDALQTWGAKGPLSIALGGEKGLTAGEEAALKKAGFVGVTMGPNILRAYTAAVGAASLACLVRAD